MTTTPDGVSDTSKHTSVVLNFLNDSEKYIHLRKGHIIENAEEVEVLSKVEPAIRSKLGSSDTSVVDSEIRQKLGSEESTDKSICIRSELGGVSQSEPIVKKVDPLLPSKGEMPTHLHAEEVEILSKVEPAIRSKLGSSDTSVVDSEIRLKLGSEKSTDKSTCIRSELGGVSQSEPIVKKVDPLLSSKGEMPTHLHDLWSRSCTNPTPDQSTRLAEVLTRYADQFSVDDLDLGCFSEVTHKVDTDSAKPIRQKMRRTHLGFENEEKQHLDGLLDIGVIQPSNSEWASPPVLIRKKVRWCIDYQALNNVTTKDAFLLPNISECLDNLVNTMYFSTLDLSSGYYQIL